MAPRSPFLARAVRFGLMGAGASAIVSGGVNLFAAFRLIDASAEQSLGITRREIIGWCVALLIAGTLLLMLGLRQRK